MDTSDVCKNCGGERGLHHYETDQCPVGGREAPLNRKQEWKTTTFEKEDNSADVIAEQKEIIKKMRRALEHIYQRADEEMGEWSSVGIAYLPENMQTLRYLRDEASKVMELE